MNDNKPQTEPSNGVVSGDWFGFPGDRCAVFDHRLFVDDKKTPLTKTMQPATVLRRYGKRSEYQPAWKYADLVDVIFDHDGRESRGHFTEGVMPLQPNH